MLKKESVYDNWPVLAYGRPKPPKEPRGQWTAWISAGGQNDAVVCRAPDKEGVKALRDRILRADEVDFLLKAIEKIDAENSERGDSDRTTALISSLRIEYDKKFRSHRG